MQHLFPSLWFTFIKAGNCLWLAPKSVKGDEWEVEKFGLAFTHNLLWTCFPCVVKQLSQSACRPASRSCALDSRPQADRLCVFPRQPEDVRCAWGLIRRHRRKTASLASPGLLESRLVRQPWSRTSFSAEEAASRWCAFVTEEVQLFRIVLLSESIP